MVASMPTTTGSFQGLTITTTTDLYASYLTDNSSFLHLLYHPYIVSESFNTSSYPSIPPTTSPAPKAMIPALLTSTPMVIAPAIFTQLLLAKLPLQIV